MKTAAIYARYSSNSQTEQSIEGQLDVCNKYAKDNDLQVVATYIDRAMTGTNDNRPDFQRMLKDSEKSSWDAVLVYALDRFGRNAVEVAVNKQKLKKTGKILVSATQRTSDNLDGTKNLDGIILENVYIGIAEYYSAELSQKVLRGLNENRKKGLFCGGSIPYGYTVIDKKLTIVEDKAKIVRFIFEQYAMGLIVPEIITKLNNLGLMHDGKPFTQNCIYGILKNKRYSGICEIHGVVYDNIYPRIISKEIIDNVQIRLARNKAGRGNKTAPYLLRFKLFCGNCGCPMAGESGTNAKGNREFYYKCYGKKKLHNGCQKQQIRKDRLEEIVLNSIIDTIKDSKTLNTMVDRLFELQSKQIGSSPVLASLLEEKSKTDKALGNLVTAVENGLMSNTTNKRLCELEQLQQKLEEKIAIEKSKQQITFSKEELKAFYIDNLKNDPQILIDNIVHKVILYDDSVTIFFNSPINTGLDESQGFLFYEKKHHIDSKKYRYAKTERIPIVVRAMI